jgi:hypothetical protein
MRATSFVVVFAEAAEGELARVGNSRDTIRFTTAPEVRRIAIDRGRKLFP